MSGPTSTGVNYRVAQDPSSTYLTVQPGSERLVVIPVIDSLDVKGRKGVTIVGFAVFFLEGVGGSGKNNYVTGRFMKMAVVGDVNKDPNASSYGAYSAVLIN